MLKEGLPVGVGVQAGGKRASHRPRRFEGELRPFAEMRAADWTLDVVWAWLEEATDTLKRLPNPDLSRLSSLRSCWPETASTAGDYAKEMRVRLGSPGMDAIARLDVVLTWLRALPTRDAQLLMACALGVKRAKLGERFGLSPRALQYRIKALLIALQARLQSFVA